jgi:hypothetical protein
MNDTIVRIYVNKCYVCHGVQIDSRCHQRLWPDHRQLDILQPT